MAGKRLKTGLLAIVTLVIVTSNALGQADAEAIPGVPFGIGRVTVPVDPSFRGDVSGLAIRERNQRLLYPALTVGTVRRLLGNLLGGGPRNRRSVTALFLFRGNEPLDLIIETPVPRRVIVQPRPDAPRNYDRLLKRWWREYHAVVRQLVKQGDHPPTVYTYLTSMLSRRLGLAAPLLSRPKPDERSEAQQTFELLAGIEAIRDAQLRATSLGQVDPNQPVTMPLPRDVIWAPLPELRIDGEVPVESIASRVPQECLYIRFGSFENYLWLTRLVRENGGDIGRMVRLRGIVDENSDRVQDQLALKQNALAEIVGPQVVADVAIIGRDPFVQEGAAIGVLFEAKNSALLLADLSKQRAEALQSEKENGAKLETIKLAGKDVSLLSTPDNRLRSFLVSDGKYHLVTTSRTVARRFIETGTDGQDLARSAEFRRARQLLPLDRDDTIFVYFSSAFFRGLVSPQYQVELQRRLQSLTDMDLLKMARLAAANEGRPAESVNALIQGGLLPVNFGRRHDGSSLQLRDGELVDSIRGRRGFFIPVADVDITGVTSGESASYLRRARYYQENWRQMDPLMIGIKRFALDDKGLERVAIDALITPFDNKKYNWILSSLGTPLPYTINKTEGDIVWWQASLRGGLLSPSVPPHVLFGAIKDQYPLTDLKPDGLLKTLQILRTTPGYLGAWPQPGFLDRLPLGLAPRPDPAGFARMPFGLWRRQYGEFAVLAFDPGLLAQVTPQLLVLDGGEPAHIRFQVGDLSRAKLATWVNSLNYERARQTSIGNIRLLQTLHQQLGVPRSAAKKTAEQLLEGKLVCSLGGEYELKETRWGVPMWRSTKAPPDSNYALPRDYQAPLMEWFRGLNSNLIQYQDKIVVHAELDMQPAPSAKAPQLPVFDLFKGLRKKKDDTKKAAAADPDVSKKAKQALKKEASKPADGPRRFRP